MTTEKRSYTETYWPVLFVNGCLISTINNKNGIKTRNRKRNGKRNEKENIHILRIIHIYIYIHFPCTNHPLSH